MNLHFKHGAQIICKVLGRSVVGRNYKYGLLCFISYGSCKICSMDCGKSGNERRKPSALHQMGEGGCFLIFKYLIYQYFHSGSL